MADQPDYILDGRHLRSEDADPDSHPKPAGRRWIGVYFECCGIYTRIYRNRQGTAYEGRCPGCTRTLRVRIGPDGVSGRFFSAS